MGTPLYIIDINNPKLHRFEEQLINIQCLACICIQPFNISGKVEVWDWIALTDINENFYILPRDKQKKYKCRYSKGRATLDFMDYGVVATALALEFMSENSRMVDKKKHHIIGTLVEKFRKAINTFENKDLYLDFINDFKMFSKNIPPVVFQSGDDGDIVSIEINPSYVSSFNKEREDYKKFMRNIDNS